MHIFRLRAFGNIKKVAFGIGLATVLGLAGLGVVSVQRASAADCDQNAIIYCGTGNASQFIAQTRKNDSKNGHHDLQAIYAYYGLEPASYDKFVSYSRSGTAYKDGRIVVDGQVVATNSRSIGRLASAQGPGYFSQNINGTTYYGNASSVVFKNDSIPVMALFNSRGVLQFAVLTSCGNPITGSLVTPAYGCNLLKHAAVSGKADTYAFTTSAYANNNATISKLVYDFGDGTSAVTTTNPATTVTHTFAKGGTFTVSVKVYVKLPGNQEVVVQSGGCSWTATVQKPSYSCTLLTTAATDPTRYAYKYMVTGAADGGATLTSADFNFGDGSSKNDVAVNKNTATTTHVYKKGTNYTAKATFNVRLPDGSTTTVSAPKCAAVVEVPVPFFRCVQLSGSILDKSKYSYQFVATTSYGNGAELKGADFDFGDSQKAVNVQSQDGGKTIVVDHTYAAPGTYNIGATLHFTANGQAVNALTCMAYVTPTQPPTPECKPGIPVNSPACTPCEYDNSLPADSPKCAAPLPPELPNTGAGNTIALSAAVAVVGFLIYRQLLFRRHKRAFLAAELGTSPPLNNNAPMSDAPEARVGHAFRSLRRRRPF